MTRAYKRYALAALTSIYMLNLVDRGLMNLLLEPIKADLQLSDTQLGLVTGIAFGLFYATFGIPIARWADKGDRVTISSLAIGLWGITVMACLWVTSFAQLALARMMAAIGEAGCKPPTYSLLGDYFPAPGERTRSMSIYYSGNFVSGLVAFAVGGWLNDRFGWRMTFFIMGCVGIVLAVAFRLTVKEPRKLTARDAVTAPPTTPMLEVLRGLWRQRTLRHITIALILTYTQGLGLNPWYASFMVRSHGMSLSELGIWFGVIFGLGGLSGTLLAGYALARWFPEAAATQLRFIAASAAMIVPCFVAFLTFPNPYAALLSLLPLFALLGAYIGPVYALMQRLVPDDQRATAMALIMLLANLIGFGIGPQVVGILSDLFTPVLGVHGLRSAMLALSFVGIWSAAHFWIAARTAEADLAAVAADTRMQSHAGAFTAEPRAGTP